MQLARGISALLSYHHLWNLLLHRTDHVRCRSLHNTACKYASQVATIAIAAVFSVKYEARLKKQFSNILKQQNQTAALR